ncbi:Nose resistant to fluoxetine protein 6 [Eumeta japonica]|uniref:Nose resistant to fluoxetine protein 6 n=1 Tax=Eumeta variegata TaxID=151549 RepID=A0A4C1XXH3_EUMVA|nr:Nose resistant to fluoxetine protein 6 [Eumeta japonica]
MRLRAYASSLNRLTAERTLADVSMMIAHIISNNNYRLIIPGDVQKVAAEQTAFSSLPALYALDAWSRCPAPARYCLVEAAILPQDSPTYRLLEDYSAQSLKHYNRTLIHRGVCVAKCAPPAAASEHDALQYCVNRTLWEEHGLQAQVLSVGWCSSSSSKALTTEERVFGIICLILLAAALLATIYHIILVTCAKAEGNKYVLAFSLKKNWSILTYNRAKPRQDERMADFSCIEGLRVLAIQCVIFSHVLFVYIYSYVDNPQYIEKMYDSPVWQTNLNAPLWVQVFFSMSACLTAYTFLVYTEKRKSNWTMFFSSIFNRWIRLTPAAVFALLFTSTWFPRLGSGPQWGLLVEREAQDCRQRWWYHALYIHNHLPLGKFCMGHTWYLAADMQLHVIGILLLLTFYRYPPRSAARAGGLVGVFGRRACACRLLR